MDKKRILIAEDEQAMANALKYKLEKDGMDVTLATNGEEAIQELKKEGYSLALLDLIMPVRDGFWVLAEAKKMDIKTPIIITSNLSQGEDMKKAKDLGAIDYFVKSDTPIYEVVDKIKKYLEK